MQSKKTYVISITRPDHRDGNNYLSSLSTNAGKISFDKNTTTYNLSVDGNVAAAKISATVEGEKASFVKNYGPRTVTLKNGKNEILIKVSAENEKVKTYTINISKADDRSSDNTLSSLTISPGSINFSKDKSSYTVDVENNVTSVTINATANDSKAKVKIDSPKELKEGENKCKVIVTAENETTKTYTIIVNRKSKSSSTSEPAMNKTTGIAKSIGVKGYDLNFDTNKTEYKIKTTDSSLDINVELEDGATYTVEGNENLVPGSIVKVIVKSKSGEEKIYTIKIEEEGLSSLKLISVIGVTLANLVVLALLIKSKAS